jgi:hypothetical protein
MGQKTYVVRKLKEGRYSPVEKIDGDTMNVSVELRRYLRDTYGSGKYNVLLIEKGKEGMRNYGTYEINGDEVEEDFVDVKTLKKKGTGGVKKAMEEKTVLEKKVVVDYDKLNAVTQAIRDGMVAVMEFIKENKIHSFTVGELRFLREHLSKGHGFLCDVNYWQEFCIRLHYNPTIVNEMIANGDDLEIDVKDINLGDFDGDIDIA